jgi:hypothetical protein
MDYNILYDIPDVIDFYVLSVGQNRYIFKGMSEVHDINCARKFVNISSAHRYARSVGREGYTVIGVKSYEVGDSMIQKLFFVTPRPRKSKDETFVMSAEEQG